MHQIITMVGLQTQNLSLVDQLLYASALIAPFCGILVGFTFYVNLHKTLRWILSWGAPFVWLGSIIVLLSQIPAKENLLLIAAVMIVFPVYLLYYLILAILSLAQIKDALFNLLFMRNSKQIFKEVLDNKPQPLPHQNLSNKTSVVFNP